MRRVLLAVLLSTAVSGAAFAAERLEVPYEMFRLKNGLTVIVHEDHSAPLATVNTWYHVGSARETPGRTGFAHLFEHIMFNGSKNVPEGAFDQWLEAVGGNNNGSTTQDRTNYWEDIPANALETALFLESDRMAYLLDTMSMARVNQQRDVVKNERRQSYENRPYGMASILLSEAIYPADHPYHWPTIGSMEDLGAATHEDVANFFKRYYGPGNTSVVIAGDVDTKTARALAEKWFGEIPAAAPVEPLAPRTVVLPGEKRLVFEDKVELPRLYISWPGPPAYSASEAALNALGGVLATGKNSRLYKRLVYDLQIAQDVTAGLDAGALSSTFDIIVTAKAGRSLEEIRKVVDEEVAHLTEKPPSQRELDRFRNDYEAKLLVRLEKVGGFGGKADQLNQYFTYTGNPGYFESDLARYRALSPADVHAVAFRYLGPGRVILSIVPEGKRNLALAEVAK
ncbi:MAG: pitrilysin family protein [Thermoanaerobaculia bacterium]